MKIKFFLISVTLFCYLQTKSQVVSDDFSYQKSINYLWYLSNSFKDIHYSDEPEIKKEKLSPNIDKVIKCLNSELIILKKKYPNSPKIQKLEEWINAEQKAYENLTGEKWLSQPLWQLIYNLVELDLKDMIIKEICNE